MASARMALLGAAFLLPFALAVLAGGCREQDGDRTAPAHGGKAAGLATQRAVDERKKTGGPRPPGHQGVSATCAAFSPDNKLVLVGFNGGGGRINPRQLRTALADSVVLWDVESGREIRRLEGHAGGVSFVAFFSDGSRAISLGWDGKFRVWDVGSGAELWAFRPEGEVFQGAASADGEHVLAYEPKKLELWNAVEEKRLKDAEMPDRIRRMVLSPDGALAFLSFESVSSTFLWDLSSWHRLEEFKLTRVEKGVVNRGHFIPVTTGLGWPAAFAPDAKTAILGKYEGAKRYLALWDIATKKVIQQLGDETLLPVDVGFAGGDKVVCRSREGRLVCWNLKGERLWETKSQHLQHLGFFTFSSDGKRALSAEGGLFVRGEQRPVMIDVSESKYSVRVWDLTKGTAKTLPFPALPEARR